MITCNFVTLLRYKLLANSDSTEVVHYNHNAQIVGSNPAAGTVREKQKSCFKTRGIIFW